MESFAFMFSLKISVYPLFFEDETSCKNSYGHVSFIISITEGSPTVEYSLSQLFIQKQLVNNHKQTYDKQYIDEN